MTEPDQGQPKGGTALLLLGLLWLIGTPTLGVLAFSFGFTLTEGASANETLFLVCGIAMLVLGLGAPPVGFIASLALNNKAGAWTYGVIVAAFVAVAFVTRDRGGPVHVEEPAVCTAPPDKAVGVPGC
ncbi:hypothetical protein ACQP2T_55850 [Nonomuraea sp. CA-143628]|uniref:hypothetical protein n=1 Tax=Nonomuraea sp. CA-143628 TaxID=3239997 RepID=UPI003D8C9BD2